MHLFEEIPVYVETPPDNADSRMENEWKRKVFHFASAIIPIAYYITDTRTALWCIGGLLGLTLAVEYMRMTSGKTREIFNRYFGKLLRSAESESYSAATYLLISSFLAVWIFHKEIAILTLLYLIFGDGMAAIVGKKFGRIRIYHKTLEGMMAFLVACFIVGFWFPHIPWHIRWVGSFTAALVEVLPLRANDNLRVPIVSGSIMQLLMVHYLGSTRLLLDGENVLAYLNF